MRVKKRALLLLAAHLGWAPIAGADEAAVKPGIRALVSKPHPMLAVAAPSRLQVTVTPQPPPPPAPAEASAPHPAAATPTPRTDIDLAPIRAGRVVAISGARAELVNEASVAEQMARKQVLVEHSGGEAKAVSLPAELRERLGKSLELPSPPTQGLQLGYRVRAYAKGAEPRAIRLSPFLIDQRGLLFDARSQEYVGTIVVAVLDESNRAATGELDTPVGVLVKAEGAVVEPSPATFSGYGPGGMQVLVVRVPHFPGDTLPIAATADFGATYNYASLAVTKPTFDVSPDQTPTIPGWGIGKATLNFHVSDIIAPDQFRLLLTRDVTGVNPNPVPFDTSGLGSLEWRSNGTGLQTIEVATAGIKMRPITVDFTVPWAFLSLAALGGIGGAFLRGRGSDRWPRVLLIGVLTALLMVGLCALGLGGWVKTVTGSDAPELTGEAAIVVLGALAAFVGVSVLVPKGQPTGA